MPGSIERRRYKRINTQLSVSFYCNETDYEGVITNISEGGMFIRTRRLSFTFEFELDVFDGMGVEVKANISEYLAFVRSLGNEW